MQHCTDCHCRLSTRSLLTAASKAAGKRTSYTWGASKRMEKTGNLLMLSCYSLTVVCSEACTALGDAWADCINVALCPKPFQALRDCVSSKDPSVARAGQTGAVHQRCWQVCTGQVGAFAACMEQANDDINKVLQTAQQWARATDVSCRLKQQRFRHCNDLLRSYRVGLFANSISDCGTAIAKFSNGGPTIHS